MHARSFSFRSGPLQSLMAFFALLLLAVSAKAQINLQLTAGIATSSTVPAGQTFAYELAYSVSGSGASGVTGLVITATLPAGLQFVGLGATPGVASSSTPAANASGTITLTMQSPISTGTSATIVINARFPEGTTANGTAITIPATATGTNLSGPVNASAVVTASASNLWTLDKRGPTGALLDQNTTYYLDIAQTTPGNLNLTSGVLTDVLPIGVLPSDVVDASGATVTGTGLAGSPTTLTWSVGAQASGTSGVIVTYTPTIRYRSAAFSASTVATNTAQFVATAVGGVVSTTSDTVSTTLFATASGALSLTKSVTPTTATPTQSVTWRLQASHSYPVALNAFIVSDTLPPNFAATSIQMANNLVNAPSGRFITVRYRRSDAPSTLSTWPGGPFAANDTLNVRNTSTNRLNLPTGVYLTYVEFDCGSVPNGFATGSGGSAFEIVGTTLLTGWDSPATVKVVGNTVTNTEGRLAANLGSTPVTPVTRTTILYTIIASTDAVRPDVTKTIQNRPATIIPGTEITYRIETRNRLSALAPLVNPVLMDLLPASVEYVAGSFVASQLGTGLTAIPNPSSSLEILSNYGGTGRTLLRWSYNYSFPANDTNTRVEFRVRVKDGTPTGTVSNQAVIYANPSLQSLPVVYDDTQSADTNDLNGNASTADLIGSTSASPTTTGTNAGFVVASSARLDSAKWVRGQKDAAESRFPNVSHTTPGGSADYRVTVSNSGSTSLTNIRIIDILPWENDTDVNTPSFDRDSDWRPVLASPVEAPSGVTVEYSTTSNPERPELIPTNTYGGVAPAWSLTPPTDITTVRSLRINFGSRVLAPGDSLELSWTMRAPVDAPTTSDSELAQPYVNGAPPAVWKIAWNSFGVVATRTDTGLDILAAEPLKVGILVEELKPPAFGDRVWNDTNHNGIQDTGEPGVSGVRVEFYRDNGDNTPDPTTDTFAGFTVTDSQGNYLFSEFPVGSYFAVVYIPAGHRMSPADATTDANDSDGAGAPFGTTLGGERVAIMPVTNLVLGELDFTWDQGIYADGTATLGDYVWIDADGNGLQGDGAQRGLNGVTVRLYQASNLVTPYATTTTADDVNGDPGYYRFDLLPVGDYVLQFVAPANTTFTTRGATGTSDATDSDPNATTGLTETINLSASEDDRTWDAGIVLPTGSLSLGDRVFNDLNNNGVFEPGIGETGIDGVVLELFLENNGNTTLDEPGDLSYGTTTSFTSGGAGFYQFSSLPPGTFHVVIGPSNFLPGGALYNFVSSTGNNPAPDPDDNVDNDDNGPAITSGHVIAAPITLATGAEPGGNTNATVDFGFYAPSELVALGNLVFLDSNNNGRFDPGSGETGVSGVTVELLRDVNSDGDVADAGESTAVLSTTTGSGGSAGYYIFDNLAPGNYQVRIPASQFQAGGALANTLSSTGNSTSPADDSSNENGLDAAAPASTGVTSNIVTLLPGLAPTAEAGALVLSYTGALTDTYVDLTVDLGFRPVVNLGNRVWHDANDDGVLGVSESGIDGVYLELFSSGQTVGVDTPVATTTTSGGGYYSFADLTPGSYFVNIPTPPAAYQRSSTSTVASDNQADGDDNGTQATTGDPVVSPVIALARGSEPDEVTDGDGTSGDLSLDFGFFAPATISGTVTVDADGDEFGDLPIQGAAVALFTDPNGDGNPTDGAQIRSTTTDAAGAYQFTNVSPGSYVLVETQPAGYRTVTDRDSTTPGDDATNSSTSDNRLPVSVADAETDSGNDFVEAADWAFCVRENGSSAEAYLVRPTGLAGVTYTLLVSPDLTANTVVWTAVSAGAIAPATTSNPDGTQTVSWTGLQNLAGLATRGFALLQVDLASSPAQTLYYGVCGWQYTLQALGCQTYSVPFLKPRLVGGTVGGVAGNTLDVTAVGVNISGSMTPGAAYFAEVTAGDQTGQRFDIASAANNAITLASDASATAGAPWSTLTTVPANLVGDTVAIHAHQTLNDILPPAEGNATNDPTTADCVQLWDGAAFAHYWLYANSGSPYWSAVGSNPVDAGATVIPSGAGVYLARRNASRTVLATGEVRLNNFALPLSAGSNFVGAAYPVAQSPAGRALTASQFTGGTNNVQADRIHIWRADGNSAATGFEAYWLLDYPAQSLRQWVPSFNSSLSNQNGTVLFPPDRATTLDLRAPLPGHVLPEPWGTVFPVAP